MLTKVVYYTIMCLINLYGLYFLINGMFYYKKKKKEKVLSKKVNHFTILIPARNEEKVISNLIDSLKKQNYDKTKYDICVVLNNSTDNTYSVVEKTGTRIINCKRVIHNKGDALREAFDILSYEDTDAYIIFDADNLADKNFLREMNKTINKGYMVAEGYRDIKYTKTNWLSSSYGIYFHIENIFFNEARNNIGKSAALSGTGFMVKKEVIESIGYNVKTLTEDIEFTTQCVLNGIRIGYVKTAIFYDEHPTKLSVSLKQRMRWSKGSLECLRLYTKRLSNNFSKTYNTSCLDIQLIFFAPFLQVFSLLSTSLSLISGTNYTYSIMICLLSNILLYLVQVLLALYVVVVNKKDIVDFLSGVLLFPVFLLTWLPINVIVLFKKDVKWEHIEHEKSLLIEELN